MQKNKNVLSRWQLSGQAWGQRRGLCSLCSVPADLFYHDRWKLVPVYWSKALSPCPPVLAHLKIQTYTYTLHTHKRDMNLSATLSSAVFPQCFSHTSAHFKCMWGTRVIGHLLLNVHERAMYSLIACGGCQHFRSEPCKSTETQKGAHFMFAWVFWFLMDSKKLSVHGGKISLAVRYFWLHAVSSVSEYLRELTRHTVGEATSLKSKDRYEVLHDSSKVHQSFQTQ